MTGSMVFGRSLRVGVGFGAEHLVDHSEDKRCCCKDTEGCQGTPCRIARGIVPNGQHAQQRRTEKGCGNERKGNKANSLWIKDPLEGQLRLLSRRVRRRLTLLRTFVVGGHPTAPERL